MVKWYRPSGFDGFYGNRVYVQVGRCPNRPSFLGGIFSKHSYFEDRYPERAEWFGFTDETIPRSILQRIRSRPPVPATAHEETDE